MSIVTLPAFDADHPLNEADVTDALRLLAGAINSLAGELQLTVGSTPSNPNPDYVPQTGGQFYGQIGAPSLLLGNPAGTQYLAVHRGDLATPAVAGLVKQAAALADLSQTITNPPSQAEVQALSDKVDALLAALRTTGLLATS